MARRLPAQAPYVTAVTPFWSCLAALIYFIVWAVFLVMLLALAIPVLLVVALWGFAQGVREELRKDKQHG